MNCTPNALIGHTGLIGSVLSAGIDFDFKCNSSNIEELTGLELGTVYCAAPSGNRLKANQQPVWDTNNTADLIRHLRTIRAERFVLISTVDTVYAPESTYGHNRLALEEFVQTEFDHCHVVRLCTLIDHSITKNLLYDLKHMQYLDHINGAMIRQYYPLSRLCADIHTVIGHDVREINFVSEPVSDQEIIDQFATGLTTTTIAVRPYNLHSTTPFGQYVLSKQQVFEHIREYMNG